MFKRVYIEITDVCNLHCSFCIGTKRPPRFMTPTEFRHICEKLKGHTEYLYFHVLGEPLLHPDFPELLLIAKEFGYKVNITTNGTLLDKNGDYLLEPPVRKVSVSLHSFEGNDGHQNSLDEYLESVWQFCQKSTNPVELRLWNEGGRNGLNGEIINFLNRKVGYDILSLPIRDGSRKLTDHIMLGFDVYFEWPSLESPYTGATFCHGMKKQMAVLVDGTVVPCCLDSSGTVSLGNLFEKNLNEILSSPRVDAMIKGFNDGKPSEELCRRCGYATRFNKR